MAAIEVENLVKSYARGMGGLGARVTALAGVSLSFDWYRNYNKNLLERNNVLRPGVVNADGTVTNTSYRPVTIFSPIDGRAITTRNSLTLYLLTKKPGATVKIGYTGRAGVAQTVSLKLASGPPQ